MFENIKSKKSPIGNEFIKRGILTEAQVNKVLEYQKEHKDLKFAEIENDGVISELDVNIDAELINNLVPLFYNNSKKDIENMP